MNIFSRISKSALDLFAPPAQSTFVIVGKDEPTAPSTSHWYRALSISGKPAGLGFACDKCHYTIPHSAPARVKHCGGVEDLKVAADTLPTRRLGGNSIGSARVFDTWDEKYL
jgi:hypothetical protein